MDTVKLVESLDEAVCIPLSAYTLGNGLNPIIFLPAMGNLQQSVGFLTLVLQPI